MTSPTVEFSLFAPYNEDAALIGSWNQWQPIPMQRRENGWWYASVPLADGEHQYKFRIKSKSYFAEGQTLDVGDPRALRVTLDADENAVVVVKDGRRVVTTYSWQHDDKPLPANDQLVLYEVHVRDFSGGIGDGQPRKGRFTDLIDKLDYLASLGINAVELMPINEFPGDYSWGYNPRSLFAIENSYGSPDDLCRLVDECHARGIRVILDGVYNHSDDRSPLSQIDYTYWYHRQNPDSSENQFGPKLNYQFYDEQMKVWPARQYVWDAICFWIECFHIDGIRFDATALIKEFDVLHWMTNEIHAFVGGRKPFITIAEHIPQDPAITGVDGPMDAAWHETFFQQITATMCGQPRDGREPYNIDGLMAVLSARPEGFGSPRNVVNYIDNHDKDRILWTLGQCSFIDDPAFRRMKLGAALLLTAPGLPMLWMGQELGESAPKVLEPQPVDWALLNNERNADLRNYYAGLIALRKAHPALTTEHIERVGYDPERAILAYKRWDDGGGVVVVVANLRDQFAGDVVIPGWPGDGVWHEYRHDYDTEVTGGVLRDQLAESEVKIFVKK